MAAEGFIGRWSRLKTRAERSSGPGAEHGGILEAPAPTPALRGTTGNRSASEPGMPLVAQVDGAIGSAVSPAVESPEKNAALGPGSRGDRPSGGSLALPDVDSLGMHSDLSMFMGADVDPHLRLRALKKLFSDPHFNRMDGLDIYVDDYSKPDPLPLAFIRRLDQSRLLGLSDEPAPERGSSAEAAAVPEANVAGVAAGTVGPDESTADEAAADQAGADQAAADQADQAAADEITRTAPIAGAGTAPRPSSGRTGDRAPLRSPLGEAAHLDRAAG